ncbi:MAG: hypothetical protein OQK82_02000, partial [Candidatus Pacearchaeota archaeon]|nr:hypothetical protein [Candidatus Pacearchaeota archaeon]
MRIRIFLLAFVFLTSFVCAGFELGDVSHNISSSYVSGEYVSGWINVSFDSVSFDSLFETSQGDEFTLLELLSSNDMVLDCDDVNCDVDYNVFGAETTKTITLGSGESKLVGIKFEQDIIDFNEVDFNISSTALQSCYNQLKIDLFNDDSFDVSNSNYSKDYCALFRTKGCFDEGEITESGIIPSHSQMCQRVELPETGGFRLGAELTGGASKSSVSFTIYTLDGYNLGSCYNYSVSGSGEFFCDIEGTVDDYMTETNEYYVCLTKQNGEDVLIDYYQDDENGCGFLGSSFPPASENFSYNIIAYSKQFNGVGKFSVEKRYFDGLVLDIKDYLESKYGSFECSVKNCVIPIKVHSFSNQDITFSELFGKVNTFGAEKYISNYFYELNETSMKYDSSYVQFYLDNLSLPVGG